MLFQHGLRDVHTPRGMLSLPARRWNGLLGNVRGDLRLGARRHGLAPPHPRDRRELLQSFPRPSLADGAARRGTHLTHFARAHSDDVRS
eukprot:11401485-Alexandrium_andersonii.AAC.1